jgi:myosin V
LQTLRLQLKGPALANQDDAHNAAAILNQEINILKHIISRIYIIWIKEFKKSLSTMVVPAVIEHQSLPAYICNKNDGGLWGISLGKPSVAFNISQLITFLDKISSTMKYYHVEESMYIQVLNEIMRLIGTTAFNHLIMRKNYCTWKRGIQIEYNVKRLEEWCIGHGVGEATLHLQSLAQAAKLLREPKTSAADVEQIYETCYLLNASQIKKLISCYYAVDFDSPVFFC